MSTPDTAGPTIRAMLNVIEFNAIALDRVSLPTISMVNDCRTGASMADEQPRMKAMT
ncbi:hypothetical protein VF34_04620 [Rhodococcus sp. PML026]|nr:hypothetical protein VF34_04620 [Rhodococcus sp. PML026]